MVRPRSLAVTGHPGEHIVSNGPRASGSERAGCSRDCPDRRLRAVLARVLDVVGHPDRPVMTGSHDGPTMIGGEGLPQVDPGLAVRAAGGWAGAAAGCR